MCSPSGCLSFFSSVISYFNCVWAVFFYSILKDFTGSTISSLCVPWRRSWQATYWCKQRPRLIWASLRSISQFTYGLRAGTDQLSDPLLSSPPHSLRSASICGSRSVHPPSIHLPIHLSTRVLDTYLHSDRVRLPLWISLPSLRAIPSVVPLEAVLTVMMPGWAPRGSPRLTSETQPDRQLERSPVQLSALARGSAEWIYSGRRKVCHREAPRVDS